MCVRVSVKLQLLSLLCHYFQSLLSFMRVCFVKKLDYTSRVKFLVETKQLVLNVAGGKLTALSGDVRVTYEWVK